MWARTKRHIKYIANVINLTAVISNTFRYGVRVFNKIQKMALCSDLATIRSGNIQNYDPVPKNHTIQPYMATGGGGRLKFTNSRSPHWNDVPYILSDKTRFSPWKVSPQITLRLSTRRSNCIEPAKNTANFRVPLITCNDLRGGKHGKWSALHAGPFTPCSHWVGGWMVSEVGGKENNSYPFRVLHPGHSAINPSSTCNKQKIIVSKVWKFANNEYGKCLMQFGIYRPTFRLFVVHYPELYNSYGFQI
jgi:hypothetical protein